MLVRIVKLTFREDCIDAFKELFEERKLDIRSAQGCSRLELLQDIHHSNVFFTYSWWDKEESLQLYKDSKVFGEVWPKTKALFAEAPEAWSVDQLHILS